MILGVPEKECTERNKELVEGIMIQHAQFWNV